MEEKEIYKGSYKDEEKEIIIDIENDFYCLSAIIGGMRFSSVDMEEWLLDESMQYTDEQWENLSIGSKTSRNGFNLVTEHFLKDCKLTFSIPQHILDKTQVKELECDLNIALTLENSLNIELTIDIDDNKIEVKNVTDFESGLKNINKQMSKTHTLFNCFNCKYSSYSIYGQAIFGSLHCYRRYKDRFLKIKNKEDYALVEEQGFETMQETSYCKEFQLPLNDQFLYK